MASTQGNLPSHGTWAAHSHGILLESSEATRRIDSGARLLGDLHQLQQLRIIRYAMYSFDPDP